MKVTVKKIRGRIIPCDGCRLQIRCSIFKSIAKYRARDPQWTQSTNLLYRCDKYEVNKIPQDIRSKSRLSDYK